MAMISSSSKNPKEHNDQDHNEENDNHDKKTTKEDNT
jgi:hypothetical protein